MRANKQCHDLLAAPFFTLPTLPFWLAAYNIHEANAEPSNKDMCIDAILNAFRYFFPNDDNDHGRNCLGGNNGLQKRTRAFEHNYMFQKIC